MKQLHDTLRMRFVSRLICQKMMENVEDCQGEPHADSGSLDAMQECLRLAAAREEGRGERLGAALPARAC